MVTRSAEMTAGGVDSVLFEVDGLSYVVGRENLVVECKS